MNGETVAGSPQRLRYDAEQLSSRISETRRTRRQLVESWQHCRAACRSGVLPAIDQTLLRSEQLQQATEQLAETLRQQAAALAAADRGRPTAADTLPLERGPFGVPPALITSTVRLALGPRNGPRVQLDGRRLAAVSSVVAWQLSLQLISGGLQLAETIGAQPYLPAWLRLLAAGPIGSGLIGVTLLSFASPAGHRDAAGAIRSEQQLWDSVFANSDPHTARRIAAQLEAAYRQLTADLAIRPPQRPADGPPPTADTIFPPELRQPLDEQRFVVSPAALQAGTHAPISSFFGEELRLLRLDQQRYLFAVNGLNLQTMQAAPNGLVAVLDTAAGAAALEHNAYYQLIRSRLLANLEQLPPGSELHLSGHSMGGGIVMLLSHDPSVAQALAAREIRLASLTTIGAVRPQGEWGTASALIDGPIIHYVDVDDRLAREVGAGHPADAADVVLFGDSAVNGSIAAHTDYAALDVAQLPPERAWLPWPIDPAFLAILPLGSVERQAQRRRAGRRRLRRTPAR
jgi:hypothetical protein